MRTRPCVTALALGLLVSGVAPAAFGTDTRNSAATDDAGSVSSLPISFLPHVPQGRLHPDPGMYLLCPHDHDPGCTRLHQDVGVPPVLGAGALVEPGTRLSASAVVLIHGLDDSGDCWRYLAPALHDSGRTVLFFEYPNDQSVAASADALADSLRWARAQGLERIDLVCHSMGGLVARDALTRPAHYGGDADAHDDLPQVDRAILIATPNAGAPLAYVRAPNDVIERALAWRHYDAPISAIFDVDSDGDGQAGLDLRPGSAFLTDLNARPAPTNVHMTVIVAQAVGEPLQDVQAEPTDAPRPGVRARLSRWWSRVVRQVIATLGDGAVPLDSASLPSADETLHVRCSHVGLLKEDPVGYWILDNAGQNPEPRPAVALVLERVSTVADGPGTTP